MTEASGIRARTRSRLPSRSKESRSPWNARTGQRIADGSNDHDNGLQHVASVRTDAHGRAQFIVPAGRYRVSVSLDGHQGQVTVVRAVSGSTSSVRLQLTASDPFAFDAAGFGRRQRSSGRDERRPRSLCNVSIEREGHPGGSGKNWQSTARFRFPTPANPPKSPYKKVTVHKSAYFWSDVPATVFLPDPTELQQLRPGAGETRNVRARVTVPTSPHYRVTVNLRDELGGALYNPSLVLYARNRSGGARVRPDNTFAGSGPARADDRLCDR